MILGDSLLILATLGGSKIGAKINRCLYALQVVYLLGFSLESLDGEAITRTHPKNS